MNEDPASQFLEALTIVAGGDAAPVRLGRRGEPVDPNGHNRPPLIRTCQHCLGKFRGPPAALWCPACRPVQLRRIARGGEVGHE